jgi:Tfp pilus assembly protein PilF
MLLLSAVSGVRGQAAQSTSGKYGTREACAGCHTEITATYSKTAMAHASGPASEDPITGGFVHRQSGLAYSVYQDGGKLWLEFSRTDAPILEGKRQLLYYIGSARLKGRTYLYEVDGFLFESPINWYAQQRLWDMTPNYQAVREAPLNLPAFPECLNCHSSGMHAPAAGTANFYPNPPFTRGGVTCERCHGSAQDHAIRGDKMLQLDKLVSSRRDAICMQCHLEGDVAVERPSKHAYEFRPGDDLSNFVRYFVLANKSGIRAVSQFEALAQSKCKRVSGDKMTCTTCHDPHSSPSSAEKVGYFRSKCLVCHGTTFAQKHHPEDPNCIGCHMPALSTKDVTHTQATDHRILRRSETVALQTSDSQPARLQPFPSSVELKDDVRDLALAYETIAERGDAGAATEAERRLELANKQEPNDPSVLTAIGYIAQQRGDTGKARQYYEAALRNDPYAEEAATNLGVLEARQGHLQRAVSLWKTVFDHTPWRSSVGIDIALGFCAAGRFDGATAYVNRVLEFNPDFSAGHALLVQLGNNPPRCSLKP